MSPLRGYTFLRAELLQQYHAFSVKLTEEKSRRDEIIVKYKHKLTEP